MQRVGSNRNPAVDMFGAGKNGFTAGDPQSGVPATTPGAEFFNAVQEELAAVVEAVVGPLDPANQSQLLLAIKKISWGGDGAARPTTLAGYGIADAAVARRSNNCDTITVSGVYSVDAGATGWPSSGSGGGLIHTAHGTQYHVQIALSVTDDIIRTRFRGPSGVWQPWTPMWTGANQGAGSGLDADRLDGQEGSYYVAGSSFVGGNQSLSANGYQKLPGGLIVQWGTTGSIPAVTSSTITLPLSFPTANVAVVITSTTNGGTGQSHDSVAAKTTSNFTLSNNASVAAIYNWIAIGY